ncbi:mitochondrial fission ELM1 family protein [Acuticoccus sp. M5D2P5]|uniref:mitochondrial fission ELM1 family protein n=1 Tax=Acuticoccus kalidii TaxID=2910977 RepID=UPI001F304BA0|nr:mitochondrial fission ELM1 family protein [Acuticoccus kalidii]MCF3936008.1 mitochondrial fission ELM1 family protein [Acuticoccus kalidii]
MPTCLILASKGKKGHERQALAIAQRLGLDTIVRVVGERSDTLTILSELERIRPAVVIGAGRQSIAPARAIARRPNPRPLVAILQPVVWRPKEFDLVWAPLHDGTSIPYGRRHRLETLTAPSAVTADERARGAAWIASRVSDLPAPRIGVLIGGASRAHSFGVDEANDLASRLAAFAEAHEASLLVSTSRRTGAAETAILRDRLRTVAHIFVDPTDPASCAPVDPSIAYAGIVERATAFVVTADSVAMLSDAAATGKPIYGWRLPGGKAKFDLFYQGLLDHGAMRWFDGSLKSWKYDPLDAASVIADTLGASLGLLDHAQHRI